MEVIANAERAVVAQLETLSGQRVRGPGDADLRDALFIRSGTASSAPHLYLLIQSYSRYTHNFTFAQYSVSDVAFKL